MFSKVDRRKEVHITQHPLCLPASLDWKQQWNYFSPFCRSAWSAAFKIKGKRVGFVSTVKHKLDTELPNTGLTNKYSYFCSVISLLSHWRLCDLILTRLDFKRAFLHLLSDLIPPGACNSLNSNTIYANNEVNLAEVDIYGFDYDYTLALYSDALNTMIYNTARTFLIEHFKVCFTLQQPHESYLHHKYFSGSFIYIFPPSCLTVPWRHQQIWLYSQLYCPGSSLWHPEGKLFKFTNVPLKEWKCPCIDNYKCHSFFPACRAFWWR